LAAAKEKTAASTTTAAAPAKLAKVEEKKQEVKTYTSNTKPGERKGNLESHDLLALSCCFSFP
jgi:hypothetical protein